MKKVVDIINEELTELAMARKGKDLFWTGSDKKGKLVTGKKAFARERDMNDETYKLRREVINHIYKAKDFLMKTLGYDLPRQTIRIIDLNPNVFIQYEGKLEPNVMGGCASRGGNDIYIPAKSITYGDLYMKYVVYHELLHSAFCLPHIPGSPLMDGEYHKITSEEIDKWLLKHVKESGKIK
jgi:hypothetical protein